MPEINNYSFSNAVFNIQEGTVINDQVTNATITISPLPGYTATASDFSLDPSFSNTYVQGVTFTQSGANVICTITFLPTATMPSNNVTIPLCVIGSAEVAEITIDGFFSANVGANVTGSPNESNTPFSNSGTQGEIESLFTKSYTAASGYYLTTTGLQVVQGNQSNYNIVQTPTYDSNNRLTSVSYDVKYIYPGESISGDRLAIARMVASEIYNPLPKISGYIFDTSALGNPEEIRTLTVLGIPDTPFSATLNDGTTTTTIINNEVIGSNGTYNHDITFPALTKGSPNVTYTIELTGSYVSDINLPNPFTVDQLNAAQIIIGKVNNVPVPVSGWPSTDPRTEIPALLSSPFEDITNSSGIWLIELDYDLLPFSGAGTFSVAKEVIDNEDFTNFGFNQKQSASNQTNVTSLQLNSTSDISPGDFGVLDGENAPYLFEVISVDSSTNLTISPAITVVNNQFINFYKDEGNKINAYSSSVTKNSNGSIKVYAKIAITHSGITGKTFDLDLSNIITHNAPTAFGMTGTHATNTAACADTSYTNTVYVTNDEFEQGKTVYTNYNSGGNQFNTPFVGNSGFYAVDINPKIAIKIDSNGVIIDAIHLCV
jgi:hypothetical protein